jgi:hypothetical protein
MLRLHCNFCCCYRCRNNHKQSKNSGSGSSGGSDSQSASYMGICKLNDSTDRVHRRIDIKVSAASIVVLVALQCTAE